MDPRRFAAHEDLVLPDRDLRLELVDQPARCRERLGSMPGRGSNDDRDVADVQFTDPVNRGDGDDARITCDALRDLGEAPHGRRVAAVVEPYDLSVGVDGRVDITNRPHEKSCSAGSRVLDSPEHLIHAQRRFADVDQTDP